ncbi:MAG: hypothetical protein JNN27_03505 [Planctomycetes bacterium]|nr:hypothetical protein [Planctomycetota bacterium]
MIPLVTSVRFLHASRLDRQQGLLGWVSAELAGVVRIDGLVLRRTLRGDIRVFPPERIDRGGRRHRVVDVIDARLERAWEAEILVALKAQGVLP